MLGRKVRHPNSTNFDSGDENQSPRPVKRLKREDTDDTVTAEPPSPSSQPRMIPDSDAESDSEDLAPQLLRKTDLETTLPQINTDQEAIDDYEASRAAQAADNDTAGNRLHNRKWIRGRSSIYVDAFNLALETVLDEESHLFDAAEKALFEYWRELSYEAQYLYELR